MHRQPLSFLVKLSVNSINCFLVSVTNTLVLCESSLVNNISNVFQSGVSVPVTNVLGVKKLDPKGRVSGWFIFLVSFISSGGLADISALVHHSISDIHLYESVKDLGSVGTCGGATAYFSYVDLSVRVRVYGLLSSTLAELQAIALVLECIPTSNSVMLFMNSQAFLDVCALLINSLISDMIKTWTNLPGIGDFNCAVIYSLHDAELSDGLYMALAKGFVLKEWVANIAYLLGPGSDGDLLVINLVCEFAEGHQFFIWILTAKLRVYYKKYGLLPRDGFVFLTISGLASMWSCIMVFDLESD
ncbi:hypothetical protein G9A89_005030 [Geosiphon pyriformis]|nr:hypothetical protein G9A89_005030 [Geosiphon pyriformis]